MNENECEGLKYSLFDPTGNITALVESPVEPARRRETAAAGAGSMAGMVSARPGRSVFGSGSTALLAFQMIRHLFPSP